MKFLIFISLMSTLAFANFNDFECDFRTQDNKSVSVDIESSFGGSQKRMNLRIDSNNNQEEYSYWVFSRYNRAFNEIEFLGSGNRLEIDLWPDQAPRWGRRYRANFSSMDLENNRYFSNIYCTFTRI